jgi:hypothetical protein
VLTLRVTQSTPNARTPSPPAERMERLTCCFGSCVASGSASGLLALHRAGTERPHTLLQRPLPAWTPQATVSWRQHCKPHKARAAACSNGEGYLAVNRNACKAAALRCAVRPVLNVACSRNDHSTLQCALHRANWPLAFQIPQLRRRPCSPQAHHHAVPSRPAKANERCCAAAVGGA